VLPGKWIKDEVVQSASEIPDHLQTAPNVILIMCDALRADHVGCYGYPAAQTATIDKLADDGVRFHHAYSQSSWTKPGTASIFSGLYPSGHNAVLKPDLLPDSVITVAEVFQGAGYYTVGFPNNINISPSFNFGQGFEEYPYLAPDYFFHASESSSQLSYYSIFRLIRERFLVKSKYPQHYYQEAKIVHQHAMEYIDRRGINDRFFMYLHYMEPHDPYFKHPFNGVGYARVDMPDPDPSWADTFIDTYDGEITYMDRWLGSLFDELKRRKLWDNTIVLLTADHGEEFFDHDGWWHGTTLYQEQIAIPIIFKLPHGRESGTVRLDNARQIDLAPTLLALCKIPSPDSMNFGRNLFGPLNSQNRQWQVFSENHEGNILSSLIDGSKKYITANIDNPRGLATEELYRLDIDPYESRNLVKEESEGLSDLRAKHHLAMIEAAKDAVKKEQKQIGEDELERMKALGYIQE